MESAPASPAAPARVGAGGAPGSMGKPMVASCRKPDWPQSGRGSDTVKLDALFAVTRIEPEANALSINMSREDNFRMPQGKMQTLNISEDLDVVSLRDV